MAYTWRNIVAFITWKCKICGDEISKDNIGGHMREHGIRCVEIYQNTAYSGEFEYPNAVKNR